jgi:RNA polymerase sigma factor (sigma-70 family)
VTVSPEGPELRLPLEQALGLCVDTAFDIVYRQAYVLWRHAANAEDLTQDVLEKLNARAIAGSLRVTGSVEAFLRKAATNLFIDQHRRRRCLTIGLEESDLPADAAPKPDQLVIAAEDAQMLHDAIEKLPESQRLVVELRLKGLSLNEIAEVLRESKSTVQSRQGAAFREMRNMFRRAGWEKGS